MDQNIKKHLTRVAVWIGSILLSVSCFAMPAAATDSELPFVNCSAYVVVEADTGQTLLEYNPDMRLYPASITKILTLGLALQKANGDLDQELTVTDEDVYSLAGTGSSHIALQPGEEVNLKDIVYATQMASANDGANVLASYIGGSIEGGVEAMNNTVEKLGLENTHFTNPHGLMDWNHYTSAADMAKIAVWALKQPDFETVFCRTDTWQMAPTNKQSDIRYFGTDDWMRIGLINYREYAKGSKSGYHDQAGQTFVTLCEQDGMRLICVLMNDVSKKIKFADACLLMDYCFSHFQPVTVDPDAENLSVSVQGGGDVLGTMELQPQPAQIILHKNNLDAQVDWEYVLPEVYTIGTELQAQQVAIIRGNDWQSDARAEYLLPLPDLAPLLEKNAGKAISVPQKSKNGNLVAIAVAAAAIIIVGAAIYRGLKNRSVNSKGIPENMSIIHHEWLPAAEIPPKNTIVKNATRNSNQPLNPRR